MACGRVREGVERTTLEFLIIFQAMEQSLQSGPKDSVSSLPSLASQVHSHAMILG